MSGRAERDGPAGQAGSDAESDDNGLGNRLVAAAIFLVAAAYTITGRGYSASFGDVLGPSVFPTLVGVPAMLLSALIALFPGGSTSWPARHRVLRQGVAVAILIAYAYLLLPLGFPLATGLLIGSLAWLMGGPPLGSLLLGVLSAPGLYLLFDRVLGLPLDLLGRWFG